jgi:hypothetical protein
MMKPVDITAMKTLLEYIIGLLVR